MMNRYIPFALSIMVGLLWLYLIVPILFRLLGIRLPFGFRQRRDVIRKFDFGQHLCLVGVLGYGTTMFLFSVADEYIAWKLSGDVSFQPTFAWIAWDLPVWLAAGALFGWMSWRGTPHRGS